MINKTYLIILSVAIVSVLVGSLLYNNMIQAQSSPEALREYDPFKDPNQDGIIDIFDVGLLSSMWSTTGEPINTTALLLDLLDRVEALENQSTPLGYIGPPAYDSGWVNINQYETLTLTHNLGTTEILVYVTGKGPGATEIHQYCYGFGYLTSGEVRGLAWLSLTDTSIKVSRAPNDLAWTQVRVMIWKIQSTP